MKYTGIRRIIHGPQDSPPRMPQRPSSKPLPCRRARRPAVPAGGRPRAPHAATPRDRLAAGGSRRAYVAELLDHRAADQARPTAPPDDVASSAQRILEYALESRRRLAPRSARRDANSSGGRGPGLGHASGHDHREGEARPSVAHQPHMRTWSGPALDAPGNLSWCPRYPRARRHPVAHASASESRRMRQALLRERGRGRCHRACGRTRAAPSRLRPRPSLPPAGTSPRRVAKGGRVSSGERRLGE